MILAHAKAKQKHGVYNIEQLFKNGEIQYNMGVKRLESERTESETLVGKSFRMYGNKVIIQQQQYCLSPPNTHRLVPLRSNDTNKTYCTCKNSYSFLLQI